MMNEQQQQQYIENEVKIRVLRETTDSKFESMHNEFALMLKNSDDKFASMEKNSDDKFAAMEKRIDDRFKAVDKELSKIDSKINWFFGATVMGVFVSIFLKVIGVF